ncbi:MAG: hypothetical protein K940chlam9_00155 [Chlamydiae bacterium]|nr:hypothetical protein [Chlamydiota bacterium]
MSCCPVPFTGTVVPSLLKSSKSEKIYVKKGILTPATGKISLPAVIVGVAAAAIGGLMMAGILPGIGTIGTYALLGGGGACTLGGIVLLALAHRSAKTYNDNVSGFGGFGGFGSGSGKGSIHNDAITGSNDGASNNNNKRNDLGNGVGTSGKRDETL